MCGGATHFRARSSGNKRRSGAVFISRRRNGRPVSRHFLRSACCLSEPLRQDLPHIPLVEFPECHDGSLVLATRTRPRWFPETDGRRANTYRDREPSPRQAQTLPRRLDWPQRETCLLDLTLIPRQRAIERESDFPAAELILPGANSDSRGQGHYGHNLAFVARCDTTGSLFALTMPHARTWVTQRR